MVEARLLRILLIECVQWEKHSKAIGDMNSKLTKAHEVIIQCQEMVNILVKEKDHLKVLLKTMALQTHTYVASSIRLEGSFNEALNSINNLEEEVSTLKYDLVETYDLYFEWLKELMDFLYLGMDLS